MSRKLFPLLCVMASLLIISCTTGKLYYQDAQGNTKLACDVEFVGLLSVDKYAVEYSLSMCAKSVVKKGGVIEETYLLDINTSIPASPCGQKWSHKLAKQHYQQGLLSKKEYGYIVANIDLGLAEVNICSV